MAKQIRVIIIQDDSSDMDGLRESIELAYPEHYKFTEQVFFVLTDDLNSKVAKAIGTYDRIVNGRSAGVFSVGGSAGFVDADFWDWMESAEASISGAQA